ncbi:ATP-dependent helicase [Kibdelosporangium phytohabitans]|uniref:DNA 3'-5' helicase n=1 Tax=Kibdelosporangium phytohabitans TaxID=860235 RepID=A0A0N9IB22_9PSEU|nr:ATP-dependent helicase [Kibdelosporangium phytohabitans]ALG13360.1 DNA helicase [Kibdelosporangium phytohabitans]
MTFRDGGDFELTPTQQAVVTKSWNAKVLVTAGPGAGKTTTLYHRVSHLLSKEGLQVDEIVVLTFSRAASRALRQRAQDAAPPGRRTHVRTFDGWAWSLLREGGYTAEQLAGYGFDERIRLAAEAVEHGDIETAASEPRHVIVDEVQDLVGVRREMIEALLDRYPDAGFTVVGDLAQSIYGFQVADPDQRVAEANWFLDWIRASYGEELDEFHLVDNFRARTAEARTALKYSAQLQRMSEDTETSAAKAAASRRLLWSALSNAPDFGGLDSAFVRDSLQNFVGTTAILCRDNGQVLLLSQQLNEACIPHRIQRSPRSGAAPAWLAGLFARTDAVSLTQERFEEFFMGLDVPDGADVRQVWRGLRSVAGKARNQLDLEVLRTAVAEERLPDELTVAPEHPLTLSTAHRAKGLEFDRVLIAGFTGVTTAGKRQDDDAAEARLLYVAMTRARDDVYRFACPDRRMIRKANRLPMPVDRWYVGARDRWMRSGVEAREFDVCHEAPAGVGMSVADPVDTQRYLVELVRPGDAVVLRRLHDMPMSAVQTPQYGIFHEGRLIGQVSERFRNDLWRLLKQSASFRVQRWPYLVTGLRIECVETVSDRKAVTDRHGLGGRGMWLAPRLFGLGRFDWSHSETVPEGDKAL